MAVCEKISRLTLFMAGIIGATGIGLAAAANHLEDPRTFSAAATVCLANAPALLALSALRNTLRAAPLAALVITLGVVIFTGDLLLRHFYGMRLFPLAAPTGGITLIIGWLIIAASALLPKPQA